jgi:hypothetical protein
MCSAMRLDFAFGLLAIYSLAALLSPSARAQAQAAPTSQQAALSELQELQLRAPELWRLRDEQCLACGATALSVGIPITSIFLPIGALVYTSANSSSYDRYGYQDGEWGPTYSNAEVKRDHRLGGALLAIGGLGVAVLAWGAWKIAKTRRARRALDGELGRLGERRSTLEQMLEGFVLGGRPGVLAEP